MIRQRCLDCGYTVYVCEDVKPFDFCPQCDSARLENLQ